ncbi:tetratricopeptide repeat protein [Tessaracoccus terricola]
MLPAGVRAELKGLPKELADIVGAHILAAGELVDSDPELAFKHAEAARRRAGRIPIVREAAAETAYAAGHYDVALREYRAIRRMNGGDEFLPVMADCERALGRPRDALELLASLDPRTKNIGLQIECLLVEAGVRDDLGQRGEAMRLLKTAISHKVGPRLAQARLRYAYAEFLLEEGHSQEARRWFEAAEKLDGEGALDVTDRVAGIDGIVLPDDFEIEQDEHEQPQPPADAVPEPVKPDADQPVDEEPQK